ncbi:MAG: MFS transporter [Patescibacteria group bacterium]
MQIFGRKYFDGKISHGFVSLYVGKTIVMITGGLLGLFLPVFLFNLFNQNFQHVIIFYGVGYLLYGITVFLGVRFLNKFGFRRALRLSVILGALFYVIFYFLDQTNWHYLIPLVIIVLTLYRVCYWLPYHVDFAKFTNKKNRSRQISAINATRGVLGIFLPLISGLLISKFGFDMLFIIAIVLYLASGIPYFTIPRTKEKFSWGYKQTVQNFFSKKYKKQMFAFAADGAETTIALVVWPIFIFQILNGDYLKMGLISTLIIGITVVLQLILGNKLDKEAKKEKVLKFGTIFSAVSWIIKAFVISAFQVFLIGAFHNLMKIFTKIPFEALTYEIAADEGHFVDEFTVLHEVAINIGKTLAIILAIMLSMFFSISLVFLIAAVASICLNLLRKSMGVENLPSRI